MGYPITHREVWRMRNWDTPCWVYWAYESPTEVVYVGIGQDVASRVSDHARKRTGWDAVVGVRALLMECRRDALELERSEIERLDPRLNIALPGRLRRAA